MSLSVAEKLKVVDVLDALGPPSADPADAYDERDAMLGLLATLPRKQRAAIVEALYDGSDAHAILPRK